METVLRGTGVETVIGPARPFVVIGERINPTGRKVFAEDLLKGDLGRVAADATAQVEAGAHALDVNAGVPGVDEVALLVQMVKLVQATVEVPLCIDSATDAALEAALDVYEGKALVNSTTGEHERMERMLPVVARHGAAVIGMANDDRGISMDPKVRLQAARRIVERAGELGIPPEDVVVDPLAMTVGADPAAARVFLETAALIREELGVNMTCGASNISFGLPGRHTIAAAFLPMAIQAGLTCAISNPLHAESRKAVLAADVLLGRDEYAKAWIKAFRAEQAAEQAAAQA